MKSSAKLSPRELEITELIAWGATKKEIAARLFISPRTVENHARNIYEKTGCQKSSELSAWWFCTRFNISFELSPIARKTIACILLAIYVAGASVGIVEHQSVRALSRINQTMRSNRKQHSIIKILAA